MWGACLGEVFFNRCSLSGVLLGKESTYGIYGMAGVCPLKVVNTSQRPKKPELNPVSVAWRDWEYCYSPLDGMLVHRRITLCPSSRQYPFIHLGGERQCGASFLSKKTAQRQGLGLKPPTFRSEVQCTNHYTTAPPPLPIEGTHLCGVTTFEVSTFVRCLPIWGPCLSGVSTLIYKLSA